MSDGIGAVSMEIPEWVAIAGVIVVLLFLFAVGKLVMLFLKG